MGQTIVEKYCLDRLPQFYSNFVIVNLSGVGILSFSEQIISTKYSIRHAHIDIMIHILILYSSLINWLIYIIND